MRIKCSSLDDFLCNLEDTTFSVYNKQVFNDITRRPLNVQGPPHSWEIYFQASAVLQNGEEELLLECGEYCGIYSETRDGTREGQETATSKRTQLEEFCEGRGWTVRPGILDI